MNSELRTAKAISERTLRLTNAAERDAFLNEACGADQALRREVESLLSVCETAGDFLRPRSQPEETELPTDLSRMRLGRYKLLEKIGEGGFGVVYMAEQFEPVQRKVAVKIIKAGMDTREVIARFEVERQVLALMDHPGVAKILDAGSTETGQPIFVMELVRGIPITEYCDHANLPTAKRLELFIKVCRAVEHAHQKGVIHRDLKPNNVLVTLHDDLAVPKIIDFGVAKALGQRLTDKTLFTGFAQMIGTPAYMSPEQAGLSGLDMDTRSDIYSLGVLLYELLTGVTPFDAETLNRAALDEIRRIIGETEPPRPSTRLETLGGKLNEVARRRQTEPKALGRLVRGDLDWIVMKCLEKNRQRRYETAGSLAQDLERHLNCEPVLARPPGTPYLAAKFLRRHRVAVSFTAVLTLACLVGLGSTLMALKRVRQHRAHAEAAATIAATINNFVQSTMLESIGQPAGTNATLVGQAMLDQLAGNVQEQFADRPLVEAAVRLELGRTYLALGNNSAAEQQLQQAVEIRGREFGADHPDTLQALGTLGYVRFKQGSPAEAEPILRRVLQGQRRRLREGDPAVMQTLAMLEAVQLATAGTNLATEVPGRTELLPDSGLLTAALDAVNRALAGDPREPGLWVRKGTLLGRMNRLEEACQTFGQAIELASNPGQMPLRNGALLARSALLKQLHHDREAQQDFLEAKGIPPRPPQAGAHLVDLSSCYNASLDEDWHQGTLVDKNDFAGLPRGLQQFGNIEFDVRGIVQLDGNNFDVHHFPKRVDITIGKRCRAMHFLHACAWNDPNEVTAGRFIFHYADGTAITRDLIYGQDFLDWWYYPGMPMEASGAALTWKGTNSSIKKYAGIKFSADCVVRLYEMRWENPRPEQEIVKLAYASEMKNGLAPFLIAITAE